MKISKIDTSNLDTYDKFSRFASRLFDELSSILNSGITFSENFNAKLVGVTFNASNTETTIAHGLPRIPSGYIVVQASAAMSVYDSGTANTDVNLYLKSSAAGNATLLIF